VFNQLEPIVIITTTTTALPPQLHPFQQSLTSSYLVFDFRTQTTA
jgi:hypothetical protein